MHLRNVEDTEDFHVERAVGRTLLETGKFVEVKPEPKPIEPTKWTVRSDRNYPPMVLGGTLAISPLIGTCAVRH